MKYEIEFDNNTVEQFFMDIYHAFEQSEHTFEDGDLMRNIVNTTNLENVMKALRLFGADTECGTYMDGEYMRVGYARIGEHVFIKNGVPNYTKLKAALWELAHPAELQTAARLPNVLTRKQFEILQKEHTGFLFSRRENGEVICEGYFGVKEDVTIPDGVTKIGRCAFCGCSTLKSVTIPESVTEIGEDAFPDHTKIIRVEPKKAVEGSSEVQTERQTPKHRAKHL